MSPAATPSSDPLLEEQLAALKALVADGLAISAAIRAQAEGGPQVVNDPAIGHARVARAVRQGLMLQSRLKAEAKLKADLRRTERKGRVERIVSRIAIGSEPDGDDVVHLIEHARELIDDEDIYGDVMTRPIGELVGEVCRDLGIEVPWTFLKEEAWAKTDAHIASLNAGATSPASGGRGPSADPAPAGEEPVVERAGDIHAPPDPPDSL